VRAIDKTLGQVYYNVANQLRARGLPPRWVVIAGEARMVPQCH
jgi:hypothetical protein